ncbi:MerR family DNA-binding transcriptional regulator [bacterium BFN5]|nr:MerR family DNA-binding transcriptional regulator [bacterium BFN5]
MNEKWTIGEVAKLFDVSTDTLRYYEKLGLFSSHKNKENGYRYYSYDEIIILMDILFFRNLELPVKEIKRIITKLDVSDIKEILYSSHNIVEHRIQELMKLQNLIYQAASQYELCEELVGKFQFVSAPNFKYKLVSNQTEDLVSMISKYKKEDWMNDRIQYVLLVSQEKILKNPNFYSAEVGLGVEEENMVVLSIPEQNELISFSKTEYLYTVIGTNYLEQRNDMLDKALHYITTTGREISGPLIGRYIASEHRNSLDYYEIWISTKLKLDL